MKRLEKVKFVHYGLVVRTVIKKAPMKDSFINDIKFNCDVSDSKYWGYFSICGLLMRYRDLYRSEKGLQPWSDIRRNEIAEWISGKESRWPELEKRDFRDLSIDGKSYHPFDIFEINRALKERGLVYGAGYAMYMKPAFFLAELGELREVSDHTVYVSDREIVRDLFTSPAMVQGRCIFVRLEPLTVLLWEKFTELTAKQGTALDDAFVRYGFLAGENIDGQFEKKLQHMASSYAGVILRHELAESLEGVPEWPEILSRAGDRKAEHYLRAIKDLVADTSDHGPFKMIIDGRDHGALGLSIALMEGFRKVLYPEIREAYGEFSRSRDWSVVEKARISGYKRFLAQRDAVINAYRNSARRNDFSRKLKAMIE